ncbi:glycoside hydrolase superfamily [Aspergillus heterothallicus]
MQRQCTLLKTWFWRVASSTQSLAPTDLQQTLTEWQPAHHNPSEIHLELRTRDLIPDYNVGQNERKIQWVGKCDWEYRCTFTTAGKATRGAKHVELFFEGLDTFAIIRLNGREILKSDNMFVPLRVDVGDHLVEMDQENELVILFESAERKGAELEKAWGERTSLMRDKKRMNMRKAQYSWGWDWGPKLLNAGPYLPVYLDVYESRIDNIHVTQELSDDLSKAEVSVSVNLAKQPEEETHILVEITQGETAVYRTTLPAQTSTSLNTTITDPEIWWPNGYGKHPLYTITATLLSRTSQPLDISTSKFGIRRIRLVQRPLLEKPGLTFMFEVNNKPLFIQGADWIPASNLLPTLTPEKYFAWVLKAHLANVNLLRVWGGGVYEPPAFWDACDDLGMLVWQDYMFACGDYPIHPDFLASIEKEAEAQTIAVRNRASLALLCGGNEDFMFADWKCEYDHDDLQGPFDDTPFPQRKIYLDVLPRVAKRLAPGVQYWANSPWGGKDKANDPTVGDIHQWEVWHGSQHPYQLYSQLSGRFVSEFGMHGYPDMRTIDAFLPPSLTDERHPQSQTIDCHNKGAGAEKRIARYMAENFRYTNNLPEYAYVSQLVQAEAYGYALRNWKRLFKGPGKEECAGAIIWQLNDCYPYTSWSFVDFYLRPKPSYYVIKRAFAGVSVGVERTLRSRFVDEDQPRESEVPQFAVFAHNMGFQEVGFVLRTRGFDMHLNKWVAGYESEREVVLAANQASELGDLRIPEEVGEESLIILLVELVDGCGKSVARIVDWPEPFRYLHWDPETRVAARVVPDSKTEDGLGLAWENVEVESNAPVKGCLLDVDSGEMVEWEDNLVDLLPGEKVVVRARGIEGREITVRWLNDWEVKKE